MQPKILPALLLIVVLASTSIREVNSQTISPPAIINPMSIPKWTNQLDNPLPVFVPTNVTDSQGTLIRQEYNVSVTEFYQQMLPTKDVNGNPTGFGETKVWGYGGIAQNPITGQTLGFTRTAPGPTFEAIRGIPVQVKWINDLVDEKGNPLQSMFPVDPSIHWANPNNIDMMAVMEQTMAGLAPPFPPGYNGSSIVVAGSTPGTSKVTNPDAYNAQSPVPIVTHLHGAQVESAWDGVPDQWFTANGLHGKDYQTLVPTDPNAAVYYYPNAQPATALWYHDHALGLTRLNVLSGLAGYYLLRDPNDSIAANLPSGAYEMPLIFQDRTFQPDGSLFYPAYGYYPDYTPPPFNYTKVEPYALSAMLGNTIIVNGKVWPNMNVNQGQYRFHVLDASNARFYNFSFSNGMPFTVIGSDGGYLKSPAQVTSVLISPAERVDILVDFSNRPAGEKIILKNNAVFNISSPNFPNQLETIGQIMQFTITNAKGPAPVTLPSKLNPTLEGSFPNLPNASKVRVLTLGEDISVSATLPMDLYLDGQRWAAPVSETPELGATEDWVLVNTFDTHNIHIHLGQFQLVSRQSYNVSAYWADWLALNGEPPLNQSTKNVPSLQPYLLGNPVGPLSYEEGWKDTVIVYSRQVTVLRVRFAQMDGSPYPFDATTGPGYVWHCHILEHEDNEMMRPLAITANGSQVTFASAIPYVFAAAVAIVIIVPAVIFAVRYRRRKKPMSSKT